MQKEQFCKDKKYHHLENKMDEQSPGWKPVDSPLSDCSGARAKPILNKKKQQMNKNEWCQSFSPHCQAKPETT